MNASRTCSLCGGNDHNSSTCAEVNGGDTGNGIMLFGVRLREGSGSFRKSVSMNNLCQLYEEEQQQPQDSSNVDAGYASDDVVHPSGRCRERKRGIPWTEEEHRLFLLGLHKVGKGDWRGISRNFVKTRTPTQVASHAQKYFLRRNNMGRRRRRSSLFDITTDAFTKSSMEEDHPNIPHEAIRPPPLPPPQPQPDNRPVKFPVKMNPAILAPPPSGESTTVKCTLTLRRPNSPAKINTSDIIRPIPMFPLPPYSKLAHLNIKETTPEEDPLPLTLKLSSAPHSDEKSPSGTFQAMSGGGDSVDIKQSRRKRSCRARV